MNEAVEILKANREQAVNELVSSLVEVVPRYALADTAELRSNIEAMFNDFLEVVEKKDITKLTNMIAALASKRANQGFAPADFQRALLLVYPIARRIVRQAGPRNDAALARSFQEIEDATFRVTAAASNIFTAAVTRQAERKVSEVEERAEALKEKSQQLEATVTSARLALHEAQELNRRIVDSLSAGVMVLEHPTARVLFCSERMGEIIGYAPEEAMDKTAFELALKGLPVEELAATVRAMDRLPMTKVELELRSGLRKVAWLRAERLHGGGTNDVRGTVVVIDDITERELLIDSFSRYVSRDVVQRLLSGSGKTHRLEGERKHCSILFADIRGFTGISERVDLEALHEMLNQYFRLMIDQIAAHDGNIDKFIGDKIMAVFTSREADGATQAARAAIAILREIEALNRRRGAAGAERIEVGIGINTGEVVMGTVGSEERMSFTVIGDAVNVADRLQALAGPGEACVGARTRELLGEQFVFADLGEHALKGRTSPERIFRLVAEPPS